MSGAHEREARKSIANTLGLDVETTSRLTTEFLLSAITSSEGQELWTQAGNTGFAFPAPASARRRSSGISTCARPSEGKRASWMRHVDDDGSPTSIASPPSLPLSRKRSVVSIRVASPDASDANDMSQTIRNDNSEDDEEAPPSGRRSRLPSVFAIKLGPEAAGAILGESSLLNFSALDASTALARRPTLTELRHREAAGRRNINFAKSLMQHLQRQQAREDFGASKIAADAQEIQSMRQLRSSHWFANVYLHKFQEILWSTCASDRAKRMLIKALSPLIIRSVLRRRRHLQTEKILPPQDLRERPSVQWLMKSSQVIGKWPVVAVEKLRGKLKPFACVEGCCAAYGGEAPTRTAVLFVTSGHAVEIPNRADVMRTVTGAHVPHRGAQASPSPPSSPPSFQGRRSSLLVSAAQQMASDVLPLLFDSDEEKLLSHRNMSVGTSAVVATSPIVSIDASQANAGESQPQSALSKNAVHLSAFQMKGLSPNAIQLYQELQHFTPGSCIGDIQIILGQSRRRTLRAWTSTTGYMVTAEEMQQLMLEYMPPSSRADCLHTAKNIAKGQLAKQSKPSVIQLKNMHGVLAVWPLQVLTHLQTLLQPQVNVLGEVVAGDLLHSSKLCITHTGVTQVEARNTLHGREDSAGVLTRTTGNSSVSSPPPSTPPSCRVIQRVTTQHCIFGVGSVVLTDLPLTTSEEWSLRSLSFSETWVAPASEVRKILVQYKCIAQSLSVGTELVAMQLNAAALAYGSGPPPNTTGAAAGSKHQFTHPNIMKSIALALRTYAAFQNLPDRSIFRFAKVLRARVTSAGESLCIEKTIPREGFVVYCGAVSLQRTETTSGGASVTKTIREVTSGTCLGFMESVVETVVEFSATCMNSCIVLCGDRQALLEAVSNGGRDFSSMYALIEKCEVLSGLKSVKAAEDSMKKKTRDKELLERDGQDKHLAATRELSLARIKAYQARMHEEAEDAELHSPNRRPLNVSAQERVDNYRATQRAFHQMTVENRVFASMGNQLYQYIKNPEVEERLAYLSDPLRIHEPVRSFNDDPNSGNIGALPRAPIVFATIDDTSGRVVQIPSLSLPRVPASSLLKPQPMSVVASPRKPETAVHPPREALAVVDSPNGRSPPQVMSASGLIKTLGGSSPRSGDRDDNALHEGSSSCVTPSHLALVSPARSHRISKGAFTLPPQPHSIVASPSDTTDVIRTGKEITTKPVPPLKNEERRFREDFHSRSIRDRVDRIFFRQPPPPPPPESGIHDDDDRTVITEETVSPRAISMHTTYTIGGMSNFTSVGTKDTPRWSELRVQSTELPEVRQWLSPDGSEGFRQHHQRDTLPSSLRQSSAHLSSNVVHINGAPHRTMIRIKAEDDDVFLQNTLRPRGQINDVGVPPFPAPGAASSARCAVIRKDISEKLSLLTIDDFDGGRTKLMMSHAQRQADPNLPPPKSTMKPVQVQPSTGRGRVATFGTTISYVVDPFHDGRMHPSAALRDDGQQRVGRVLPRSMLQGAKNGLDVLSKAERALLVERAFTVTTKPDE
jgi:CRP-like cAMP-binding protein